MSDFAPETAAPPPATLPRLVALDQFRGYTVAGMFLVNFLGSYEICPLIWRHSNTYCSYADTIMPQFFFAVGFAMRLSFLRRQQQSGTPAAWSRLVRRIIGLAVIAIAWYGYGEFSEIRRRLPAEGIGPTLYWLFKGPLFQTLLHIAATSLWILPVLAATKNVRVAYAALSAVIHLGLSYAFYFNWVHTPPESIDGGPLGFLTWTIPTIGGTLACDYWMSAAGSPKLNPYLWSGLGLMTLGWLLSCGTTIYNLPPTEWETRASQKYADNPVIPSKTEWEAWQIQPAEPPFNPPPNQDRRKGNYWMMSQQHGTPSYLIFSTGLSFIIFAGFIWLSENQGIQFSLFRTLGINALAGYILHSISAEIVAPHLKQNSPATEVYAGFVVYFLLVYLVLRLMEWRNIRLRI